MPIDNKHPSYDEMMKKTKLVRDFAGGEFPVKAAKELYLPMLSGQTTTEYDAYLTRGFLIPAVEPTKQAIVGSIMRNNAVVSGGLESIDADVDGNGQSLEQFASEAICQLLLAGGGGYLIEVDKIKSYTKQSIINWSDTFVVLAQEYQEPSAKDKYKIETKVEYLELTYDENGRYIQRIWRGKGKDLKPGPDIYPDVRGEAITEIPFKHVGATADPILLHLASTNLDQYRMSTDMRHGLHWTALPTLFLFGEFTDEAGNQKQISIGAGSFNQVNDTDGKAELLEFTGAGLGALKQAIDDNVKTMASIGAVMLTNGEAGGVKSAETSRIEASSETATLSNIANIIDDLMEWAGVTLANWGVAPSSYAVNRDFIDVKLDPAALLAFLQTWQSGGMSLPSFLYQLERGELLPPDVSAEDEQERIAQDPAPFNLEPDNANE